ncbi:type IV pilus assembly protein PilM [Halobacteroides halobius DSM 5150]|uniref:Type IV pilus assembly protein PilM n=1 Tax=Halobacteroides halobius (strain ATCC 35273 / DSM 5150 / MD-1) TaxID=748449 RepID=L0KBG5_HALHC|nr:type IV pilus assembly protein PilM [Halobacteroides halobius]AGB41719.1 type IV pilus assembly protein PilM [Halobacteroides halobius DSM 5150]
MGILNTIKNLFKQQVIGLDIGNNLIKIVELEKENDTILLTNVAVAKTPQAAVQEGVLNDIDLLAEKINCLLKENKFKAHKIVTAVSGEEVIIRTVEVPSMPAEELAEAVKWEAKGQLPVAVEDAILDYEILKKGNGAYQLLVIAVKEEVINTYLKLFKRLRLDPVAIEIEATAMTNVLQCLDTKQIVGVVDIGGLTTDVSIYEAGELLFTRTIEAGSQNITEEIADSYQLDLKEAEDYKLNNNIFSDDKLRPVIRSWVTAIYRSLDYFQVKYNDYELNKLFLTGQGSNLTGLINHLENEFKIEIELLTSLDCIEIKEENSNSISNFSSSLGVAIGLAIRGLKSNG